MVNMGNTEASIFQKLWFRRLVNLRKHTKKLKTILVLRRNLTIILKIMQEDPLGKEAGIIGEVSGEYHGKAWMKTGIGGKRILDMLAGEQLPRIC